MTFKILKIEKGENRFGHFKKSDFFEITVEFQLTGEHDKEKHFGMLGKYFGAFVLFDKQKYEDYYNNLPEDDMYFEDIPGTELSEMKFKSKSPQQLGYCKVMDCKGADCIEEIGDGKYRYHQFISLNYITQAAVNQLEEMKWHIDNDFCRYGKYPEQNGAFRSGDPFHDFVGILETLDRFWD
jgi:hypothetical protein